MPNTPSQLSVQRVLICGAAIITLSMGIRHGFGLWLQPITQDQGWPRETFAFAMAVQNLSWGLFGVFAGMLADRFGGHKVLMGGALLYAIGLAGMALTTSPLGFTTFTGLVLGAAQSGTTYAILYGIVGRQIPPERRSWAMGMAAAAGSFGQFLMVPVESGLIQTLGWQSALLVLSAAALLMAPLSTLLREPNQRSTTDQASSARTRPQSMPHAMREALGHRSFQLLMAGYFVCGFQVVFIGVHMPSYLKDHGLSPSVAGYSLAIIGLFNVVGTYIAGALGQHIAKRKILAFVYLARSVCIAVFLATPLSPVSVYVFSAAMGLLWLSTVPPTNAIVAGIFGVQHLSMLSGFVFLSHQIGSFAGVWLGGALYDSTGSYDTVWFISIALGVMAMAAHLPIKETPIHRAPTRLESLT